MSGLKIAVIGGGSTYTPEIIEGFINNRHELPIKQLVLVDIPEGEEKLKIIERLAVRMVTKSKAPLEISSTLDRRQALDGADFVVSQFRVGGLAARICDERLPLKYNVLGQETTGAGGFSCALRTIPVILDICRDIEELCPNAWLINFTNPAGIITETVLKHTNVKCIGLCNVPINMVKMAAKLLEAADNEIAIDFAGLNHLVWGTKVWQKGRDVTAGLLEKLQDSNDLTMKNIPDLKWSKALLHSLQMLPCPYHRYYYMSDRIIAEEIKDAKTGNKGTRAEQVQKTERRLFELYKDEMLAVKPKELESRGGAYYSEIAVSLISAIYNDKREIHTVNTLNNGAIQGLPDDCVIETNCIVDGQGARPLTAGKLPYEILGLIQQVKAYEILAIESGVHGDTGKALQALINHPLIPSANVAESLLKDILQVNKQFLPQFKKRNQVLWC